MNRAIWTILPEVEDATGVDFSGDDFSENGISSLHSIGAPLPDGYFVGEHACDFEDAVVGDAWNAPLSLWKASDSCHGRAI